MKLTVFPLLILMVATLTACGQSEDEKFLTEFADFWGRNTALVIDIRKEVIQDLSRIVPTEKYEEDFQKYFQAQEALLDAKIELDYLEQIEQEQWRRRGNGYVASCHHIAVDPIVWWEASDEYVIACSTWNQVSSESVWESGKWLGIFISEGIPIQVR